MFAEFWGSFSVPAFAGYAFSNDDEGKRARPKFPYITYEIRRAAFGVSTIISASVWDRQNATPNFRGRTNKILEQIEKSVPEGGALFKFESGSVWINRAGNFIEYQKQADPDDRLIVRAVVTVEVKGFVV